MPPRSGHPLLLPSVLTVALPSGLAAWLAWRRSTWAPVAVIDIAAPAEEIFDVIVDARNEPRWNPKMLRAQMLIPGPVAAGTTFRVVFGRGVGEALIEDTKIDRPRSWTATSRSRALDAQTEGQIHDISGRCEVFLHTQLRPPQVLAPAHSGVGLVDAPDLDPDLRRVKGLVEHEASTVSRRQVIEVDPAQPLLIVTSAANGIID